MNQTPHVGPLDPKPGAPEALKQPTRLVRIIDGEDWQEFDFPSMHLQACGRIGSHPDLQGN
jgi:hypothetical protein